MIPESPIPASRPAAGTEVSPASHGFPIRRGVNISHWLSQSKRRGPERAAFITEADFERIASLGYDHIRLPVDEEQLWDEAGRRHEDAFALMHQGLSWARKYGLRAVADLHIIRAHHFNHAERPLWTDPAEQDRFLGLWRDLSAALGDYPLDFLAYELMNEAVAEDPEDWNRLIARSVAALREREAERKIVIGSNRWQTAKTFNVLRVPKNDRHLILSFHFYEPFLLTHYRTAWTPIRDYTGAVDYPGAITDADDLANAGTRTREAVAEHTGVFDRNVLEAMLQPPLDLGRRLGLPLYCGEWGCYPAAPERARHRWYADVRRILEKHGIAWANWDYRGGFGIVDRGTGEVHEDLVKILLG